VKKLLLALLLAPVPALAQPQPYVNLFAGAVVFDSTVTVGGTKLIDQGGDALALGARVGVGNSAPGVYFGGEVEGFLASGRSRALVNGEVYSLSLRSGAGAYGRVGWRTYGNSIFFARGGYLAVNTNRGWRSAPAAGIGAEVPFGPGWTARIDLGFASVGGVEHYQMNAGISYRF
jgi:hypothetical protein